MKKNERKDLVTNIYTADPSAHVFNGKIYIYPSHDEDLDIPEDDDGEQYVMKDYHILSMDNLDSDCVDNGVAISENDIPWVSRQLWAPDAVYTNGKYYLVFPAKDKDDIFRIGVAESDSPVGPLSLRITTFRAATALTLQSSSTMTAGSGATTAVSGAASSRCGSPVHLIPMSTVPKVTRRLWDPWFPSSHLT